MWYEYFIIFVIFVVVDETISGNVVLRLPRVGHGIRRRRGGSGDGAAAVAARRQQRYLNTKSSWQSKELTKTGPRTPDLETMPSMRMTTHSCV